MIHPTRALPTVVFDVLHQRVRDAQDSARKVFNTAEGDALAKS